MSNKDHLHLLWTSDNKITAEKMILMYSTNSMRRGWWKKVTVIIWGAPAQLVSEDVEILEKIEEAKAEGVHFSACRACADQLEVTDKLEKMGIEVIYWGEPLTTLLKEQMPLVTV
ncbi:MAG TPA: hypothetical protein VJ969_01620 [Desulfopila sp.]|nr:hypothetical protein [Desulfopila sp.]